jgi:hypothetical protein
MDAFGHKHGALRSLHIFGLLVMLKSTFVVFMCVYNMCKAIIDFWMFMDSHFGLCLCLMCFLCVQIIYFAMGKGLNPHHVFVYVHHVRLGRGLWSLFECLYGS